jgi:hypothetical protein
VTTLRHSSLTDALTLTWMQVRLRLPFVPPDPHGAVGPNSIIVVTNTEIELRRKTGDSITAPTPLATMFGRSLRPPNVFDPKILYDVHQQ